MKLIWHEIRAMLAIALLETALSIEPQIVDEAMALRRAAQDIVKAAERLTAHATPEGRGA